MRIPAIPLLPWRLFTEPAVTEVHHTSGHTALRVEGLMCGLCAARTRAELAALPGVETAAVDLRTGRAVLTHPGDGPGEAALRAALERVVVLPEGRRWVARLAGVFRLRRIHPEAAQR